MKIWATKLLIRLLNRITIPSYKGIEKKEIIDEWLLALWTSEGFQSYLRYRDLQILKTMGNGLPEKAYWIYLGRRAELQDMAGKSREIHDRMEKEKEREKRKVEVREEK